MIFREFDSFSSLKSFLAGLDNQVMGISSAICETGEPYVEFSESGLARPADIEIVERHVARAMSRRLLDYINSRSGRIYWRIPFESEVSPIQVVVQYDENGPDFDPILARKCVADKDWMAVQCYCRLYRATSRFMEIARSS